MIAALRNQFGGHAVNAVETAKRRSDRELDGDENPLLEGLQLRRTPEPCVAGDLRRLRRSDAAQADAALYTSPSGDLLPERFAVVGVARTRGDRREFREQMKEAVQQLRARRVPTRRLGRARRRDALRARSTSPTPSGEDALASCSTSSTRARHAGNRLYYLAVPPSAIGDDRRASSASAARADGLDRG